MCDKDAALMATHVERACADSWALVAQVVALPPVEAVVTGVVKTSDIPACNEKVDIWALGVTLYELLTGIARSCFEL